MMPPPLPPNPENPVPHTQALRRPRRFPARAAALFGLFLLVCAPHIRAGDAASRQSAAPEQEAALFASWQKLAAWLYPPQEGEASGNGKGRDAVNLQLHLLEIPGVPEDLDLPPLDLTWVPGGNRFEIEGRHAGKRYQIGRREDSLWLHAPDRQFAIAGKPDVPLFPRLSDLRRPLELPSLTPPIPRQVASGLPAVLSREFLGEREIRGNEALGFQLSPAKAVRDQFNLPDASIDYWFTVDEGMPARLVYRSPDTGTVALELAGIQTGADSGDVGRAPAESDSYRKEVALYHLVRMFENLLNPPDRSNIPVIENNGGVELLAEAHGGRLESHSGLRVLYLNGSAEEIGRQHGTLMLEEIHEVVDRLVYGVGMTSSFAKGRWFVDEIEEARDLARDHVEPRHFKEMHALAQASGLDSAEIEVANFFPELFHCSGFALSGEATADGRLYHGRILDYLRGMGLEQNAVISVIRPENRNAWVNVGYAGFIGSVTAMNEHGLAIGEMGGSSPGHWDGLPMAQLVREVMEQCETIDEAVELMRSTPRTNEYYYVISDGKSDRAVGIRATPDEFETVWPGEAHELLPDPVPDAVLLSQGDRYDKLVRRVKEHYGSFDSDRAWQLMDRPVALGSNIQTVLFRPETLDFWVANAGPDSVASQNEPIAFNLGELLEKSRAREASASSSETAGSDHRTPY